MKHLLSLKVFFIIFISIVCIVMSNAQAPDASWIKRIDGNNLTDMVKDIAVDGNNNIYITGYTKRSSTEWDYFTLKFSPDGKLLKYDSLDPGGVDVPNSMAIQGSNLYITGKSKQGTYYKVTTIKYDITNLSRGWVKTFSGGSQNDEGKVVKIGSDGRPYIGVNLKYTSASDVGLIRYSLDGSVITSTAMGGSYCLVSMLMDNNDNTYIVGSTGTSMFLTKYNNSFVNQYIKTQAYFTPLGIFADTSGYLYIPNNDLSSQVTTRIYTSSDGAAIQTLSSIIPNIAGGIKANDLVVNNSDKSIYITGEVAAERFNGTDAFRVFLVKHSYNGSQWSTYSTWQRIYGMGSGSDCFSGRKLKLDLDGNIYIAAMHNYQYGGDSPKILLLKYNSSGTLQWSKDVVPDLGDFRDTLTVMASDQSGNIYLGGATRGNIFATGYPDYYDMMLEKFNVGGIFQSRAHYENNTLTEVSESLKEFELSQNFPNPFNPTTIIKFVLPEAGKVTVKIYDVIGREISTLINNVFYERGSHTVNFDGSNLSSGVYFYRIYTENYKNQSIRKMLLIK